VLEIPALESPFAERPLSRLIANPLSDSQALRILLVEDHEDSARLIAQLLRKLNYQVTSAGTVHGALQAAESEQFDLLGQLRKKWPIQGIALTGFGMEEDMKMSHEAGFLEHLTKPVNFQKLEMAIQRAAVVPRE
jgi:two-component system CheB/CheR fusion protein